MESRSSIRQVSACSHSELQQGERTKEAVCGRVGSHSIVGDGEGVLGRVESTLKELERIELQVVRATLILSRNTIECDGEEAMILVRD